ncbi:MAG: glycosyltransferase family 2 protein [Nitrososphaerales archaeon]
MFSYVFSLVFTILILVATVFVAYSGLLFFAGLSYKSKLRKSTKTPKISVVVAAKNESKYLGNLLSGLVKQDYPEDKYEIIVAEDGSTDSTREIAKSWSLKYPSKIKLVCSNESIGKPAALNRALGLASGEIIGQVDADSSVGEGLLRSVALAFEDDVVAIQGQSSVENSNQNLLSKVTAYEQEVWNRYSIQGRARLNLFVPCLGNLSFVRRSVLDEVSGWDTSALAEDIELSLQMWLKGYKFEYRPEVKCDEVTVSKLSSFYRQRLRWYGGYLQSLIRHGNLLRKVNAQAIDGEILLSGPLTGIMGLLVLVLGLTAFALGVNTIQLISWAPYTLGSYTIFSSVATIAAVRYEKARRPWKLIPAVYFYWFLESVVSVIALLKVLFKRKITWTRTEK